MSESPLVDSTDWLTTKDLNPALRIRLLLFDQDVQSVQLAYRDYRGTVERLSAYEGVGVDRAALSEAFHHAKTFTCAMRRVARLAEDLQANRDRVNPDVGRDLKVTWRKKRALLEAYIKPRDAIEHIDGEVKGRTSWIMMNLSDDELRVTEDPQHAAPISGSAVNSVMSLREDILAALSRS